MTFLSRTLHGCILTNSTLLYGHELYITVWSRTVSVYTHGFRLMRCKLTAAVATMCFSICIYIHAYDFIVTNCTLLYCHELCMYTHTRQGFRLMRRKHHCRRCGHVFMYIYIYICIYICMSLLSQTFHVCVYIYSLWTYSNAEFVIIQYIYIYIYIYVCLYCHKLSTTVLSRTLHYCMFTNCICIHTHVRGSEGYGADTKYL